jgi:dUTP pyrophosphatase
LKKNNGGRSSLEIKIKKLNSTAIIPTRGSKYAAGVDLYANISEPVIIYPHTTVKIGTGLSIEVPKGYFGAIVARSGLATKHGIAPANKIGVCDEDYVGEYIIALHNDTEMPYTVQPNERIAQLVVIPYLSYDFIEVNELMNTERGSGGFGSTGK